MKRKSLLALFLVMVIVFTACRKAPNDENGNVSNGEDTATVTPVPSVDTEEAPMEEAPNDTVEDTTLPSNATLDEIRAAVVANLGDNYVANMSYDSATVDELFGVNPMWYDAAIAEGPMMSANVDKFLAFHATEGHLDEIKTALDAYRDSIIADTMQYPMNLVKVQGCMVETIGEYVFLVMVGFIDDTAYEADEDMIAAYKEINQSVLDIARGIIK